MDHANQAITNLMENNVSPNRTTNSQVMRKCSRCQNHGLIVPQKGHKSVCIYRNCPCKRCKLFSNRQSTKSRRNRVRTLTQEKDSTSLSVDMSFLGSGPQSVKNLNGNYDSNSGDLSVSNHENNETQDGNNDVTRISPSMNSVSSNQLLSATKSWLQWRNWTDSNVFLNASSDSNTSSTNWRTVQRCTLCRNHGVVSSVKDHKRFCYFRTCQCKSCYNTRKKRKESAKNTADKRAAAQDKKYMDNIRELVKTTMPPQQINYIPPVSQPPWSVEGNYVGDGINHLISTPTPRKVPVDRIIPPLIDSIQSEPSFNVEIILARSMTLLQQFQNPWDILTLIYVTVKYAGANVYEAVKRIYEAKKEIESLEIFNMVKNIWNDKMSYFPEYIPKTDITDAPTYEGEAPFIGDPTSQATEHFTLIPDLENTRIPTNNNSSEHYTK
ncbi:PREDICTED: uncharacterized protein LOC107074092 [Polistes dominula]|uniref:Uncharacterized protein LOC107074092 n=1 Tax=Polistes dominula TaxID=743375 RepID=A0ABM1JDU4_POLDO|nr:PREDICTED: uncharacterized protein LOC107074092 [Polistes dominula]XP_015190634.1 PREDICTED: uncharacterized protein LOC107074092 [Polistes dominula]XP_015190635.1 PREDICTED: uncharacterized protein LOC107074092 [Polistes dominula]